MPRCARSIVCGVAVHVIQRGNNRGVCFFGDGDRLAYLRFLYRTALETGCAVHAYCLMTNHVHLLLTPSSGPDACAMLMKSLGQLYTQHVNRTHKRSGTLWEGRYRSCVAATERYVLACYRYIELNPVRAGMVSRPQDYLWSSHRHNAEGRADSIIVPHAALESLGADGEKRRRAYRDLVHARLEPEVIDEIRSATRGNRTLGAAKKNRGRPAKMGSVPIFQVLDSSGVRDATPEHCAQLPIGAP